MIQANPSAESERRVLAYPPEAILTSAQLSEWLQVSERTIESWPLPRLKLPGKMVRYSAGMVLAYLEGRGVGA